jgi:hypothetical protein
MTINFNDITDTATPTSGTFNTGGNSNVKGTGQNFLTYSKSFTSGWNFASGTFTTNTATDPLGGSTAATLTMSGATTANFYQNFTTTSGVTYTWSIYAKAGTTSTVELACYTPSAAYGVTVNLSTGAVTATSGAGVSNSVTSVGNGWYRIIATVNCLSAGTGYLQVNVIGNANTCFLWGAQVEVGTTANAFVATTTTAIYNTPQLTFSGVANIGLQSDGALFVQPAGTGALQAQATTSTTAGGNARGAYSVDFQTQRGSAARVASGTNAFIGAGYDNAASNLYSFVGSGYSNTASGFASAVSGGRSNIGSNDYSVVSGGYTNTASGQYSAVIGGYNNTAAGLYNFIGGGQTNSGTANAAVTTQSATMNGTTAVTLSGSNASIKVGQIIFGTSISSGVTYVAAISGTSLTLSTAATGSSTSTLSFYTPHGVVVGGGNNQATGAYSFIGGGGDAGTAANRNVASGDWSTVGGGIKNQASGLQSFVGGGTNNTNNGNASVISGGNLNSITSFINNAFIGGGTGNSANATGSAVVAGYSNISNGQYSFVASGVLGTTRSINGNNVFSSGYQPIGGTVGLSQSALLVLGVQTTDATSTVLKSDVNAAGTSNQVILPNNSAYYFTGTCIANVTGAAAGAAWSFEGAIMRGANAASTVLIGTPVLNRVAVSSGASLWSIALTADTTNGGLAVTVTGVASTTIRWVAKLETTEVTY